VTQQERWQSVFEDYLDGSKPIERDSFLEILQVGRRRYRTLHMHNCMRSDAALLSGELSMDTHDSGKVCLKVNKSRGQKSCIINNFVFPCGNVL